MTAQVTPKETSPGRQFRLGVDVGGTFTDLILIDEESGESHRAKTLSTFPNPSIGVLRGIDKLVSDVGIGRHQIEQVMHGTTAATNAVLEQKGARVGLIVTRGFRQLLHLGRGHIPGGLGAWVNWQQPESLAKLEDTVESIGRIDATGKVVEELDAAALRADVAHLVEATDLQAIAIALFNAHVNDCHERDVESLLRDAGWTGSISLSSVVAPEQGEYERALTTVMNAFVSPVVSEYCQDLQRRLSVDAADSTLHILRSDGGLMSVESAAAQPVNMLLSGPAGGVAGALAIASAVGVDDFLTLDMGGTSTDVALVEAGRPEMSRETTVGDFTVRSAAISVHTVGAGGGSIAHVPPITKALRVGPASAGSMPGPAAYGRGGQSPTVTDANVVLGFLPDARLADELSLDREASHTAVQQIADATGLALLDAAAGIYDVVNENMLGALRVVSVQRGRDPRDFALVAFGGAGPLHANALARLLGSWPVIVPPAPGVLCAYGEAMTQMRNEAFRAVVRPLGEITATELRAVLDELTRQAASVLESDGVAPGRWVRRCEADLRYSGQREPLTVELPEELVAGADIMRGIEQALDAEHQRLYTFTLDTAPELVTVRVVVEAVVGTIELSALPDAGPDPGTAVTGETRIWLEGAWHTATVYARFQLGAGNRIEGPAIITEMDSTTLVLPGHIATVDPLANIVIRPAEGGPVVESLT